MNSEKAQQEITNILSTVKQPTHKQYPVAKHQIATLTELGILELMPAKFGYTDAAAVIEAAQDAGKLVGGMNAYGEGDETRTNASALYLAINEVEEPEADVVLEALLQHRDFANETFQENNVLSHEQYAATYANMMLPGVKAREQRAALKREIVNLLTIAEQAIVDGYILRFTEPHLIGVSANDVPDSAIATQRLSAGHIATAERYVIAYLVQAEKSNA